MAIIAPISITESGAVPPFVSAEVGGDVVSATGVGLVIVEFMNGTLSPLSVTLDIADPVVVDPVHGNLTKASPSLVAQAGKVAIFSLKNPYGLAGGDGNVSFSYSAVGLSVRAFRV